MLDYTHLFPFVFLFTWPWEMFLKKVSNFFENEKPGYVGKLDYLYFRYACGVSVYITYTHFQDGFLFKRT